MGSVPCGWVDDRQGDTPGHRSLVDSSLDLSLRAWCREALSRIAFAWQTRQGIMNSMTLE
jgi:hypothetical protein